MSATAVVARIRADKTEYFTLDRIGRAAWVANAREAANFASVREATRQAMRLPSAVRAFALPAAGGLDAESRAA